MICNYRLPTPEVPVPPPVIIPEPVGPEPIDIQQEAELAELRTVLSEIRAYLEEDSVRNPFPRSPNLNGLQVVAGKTRVEWQGPFRKSASLFVDTTNVTNVCYVYEQTTGTEGQAFPLPPGTKMWIDFDVPKGASSVVLYFVFTTTEGGSVLKTALG